MQANRFVRAMALFAGIALPAAALDIEVEVLDKAGKPVQGLTAADVQIELGRGGRESGGVGKLRYVNGLAETKIYVGAEMPPTDFRLIQEAVGRLIEEAPAGVEVSLGGAPFTADKGKLREYLALGVELAKKAPEAGLAKIWDFGQAYRVQGRPILDNYTLLASQLAAVPGQKRVILYRLALELRQDGLDTREMNIRTGQLRQNDADMLRNEDAIQKMGTVAAIARTRFYTTNASVNPNDMNDHGLNTVARTTGGKPVLGVGNPYDVVEAALEDLPGYYVATVDAPFEGKGGRRNLKATVHRDGAEAHLARAFLLDLPGLESLGAAGEDLLAKGAAEGDLKIRAEHWVFRGPEGGPMLIVAAGAPVESLSGAEAPGGVAVELALAGGYPAGDGWKTVARRGSRQVFAKKAFESARKQGGVSIELTASGELPGPGVQLWKTVVRDVERGAVGVVENEVAVHDLSRPMATSDVLITRKAISVNPDTPAEPWGDLLDFGGSRLIPESTREFKAGEPLLFTYRLYNAPKEMLDSPPPVQLAVFKDEVQLESFDGEGRSRVIEGKAEIQYVGSIETKGLEPGEYLILSAVPGREDERHPYVEGEFRLVKK
jgi:hypothetical protein